jgi:hypothetical protein
MLRRFIAIASTAAIGAASREWRNTMVRKVVTALAAITFTGAMAISSTADARMGGGGGFRGGGGGGGFTAG